MPCRCRGPAFRSFGNLIDRVIELGYERICRRGIALGVPLISHSCLSYSFRMEFNAWTSHAIVQESGDAPPTRGRSAFFPYLNPQYVALSPCSTPLPNLRLPSHPSFRSDAPQAQHEPQPVNGELLPKLFCGWSSWLEIIEQSGPRQSTLQSILGRQRWLLRYLGRAWSGRESECRRNSNPEIQVRLSAQEARSSA